MRYHLTLTTPDATITASDDGVTRSLAGIAVPYGETGATNFGRLRIRPGAIRVPENLRRVKLFREHGRSTPIGYATAATDTPAALLMSFHVARTADGDTALIEAAEGVRDALSVELANVELANGNEIVAADLVGVAQVAVPAFAGAVLTASDDPDTTNDPPADADPTAGGTTDPQDPQDPQDDDGEPADDDDDGETADDETEHAMTQTLEPDAVVAASLNPTPARPGARTPQTLTEFAQAAAGVMTGATDAAQVNAALSDLTPTASDPSGAFMRPAWLGELWTPIAADRFFSEAIGSSPLTSMTWEGWKWGVRPVVAPYAGDKAAVPSNVATIVPETGEAGRLAGGWDVDRVYQDFNTGFIEAVLTAATLDYGIKSELSLATFIQTNAVAVAGPAADASAGLVALAQQLASVGAEMNFVGMAPDVFAAFLGMAPADVPWWLQNQGSVSIATEGATVADVTVGVSHNLASGLMVAGDRRAVDFRETGPYRAQAVNIPNGGIDIGVFGYQGAILHDALGLAKIAVTVPIPAAAAEAPTPVSYRDAVASLGSADRPAARRTRSE